MNTQPSTTSAASARLESDVRLRTGVQVRYSMQGAGGGESLVFVHGWPDSRFSFSQVIAHLELERSRAFAYDQRGFGDSERPLDGYTVDHFAEDAIAFLDAVGIERATFIGHSFGTFVARRAAQLHPTRVARLVLIGSAVTANNEVTHEVLDALEDLRDPIPVEFVREFQASTLHIPVPEAFFARLVEESSKAPARVWRDTFARLLTFDDQAKLGRMVAPTLVVWGEHDALFADRAEQERLATTIPDAQLIVFNDTGHSPNWERPEAVAHEIQGFTAARK